MDLIKFEATNDSPEIVCDAQQGIISIQGASFPEQAQGLYQHILDWVDALPITLDMAFSCNFFFTFINSSSRKMLYEVLSRLKRKVAEGNLSVTWTYLEDDEDIEELGEELGQVMDIPLQICVKSEDEIDLDVFRKS